MEKTIKIGKQEVRLNNNVAWTMEYRDQFGKDILPALMPLVASMLESAAAIYADKSGELTFADILESLEGRTMEIFLPLFQAEFVDLIVNVTWAMAKAADEDIEPPKKWVKQFDSFPLDVIVPTVGEMALKGFTSSKNLKRLTSLRKSISAARTNQPSRSMTSSSQDSSEG